MKKYDVIVIGAGNGGLAAAATCAKATENAAILLKVFLIKFSPSFNFIHITRYVYHTTKTSFLQYILQKISLLFLFFVYFKFFCSIIYEEKNFFQNFPKKS